MSSRLQLGMGCGKPGGVGETSPEPTVFFGPTISNS